jgi:hypothetical protein
MVPADPDIVFTTHVENVGKHPIEFALEPWGEVFSVAPGEVVQIVFEGPQGKPICVEHSEARIVVWGWEGSTARLFRDGAELGVARTRVPTGLDVMKPILKQHDASN